MSDKVLSSLLTAVILAVLAVWVPLLEAYAWLSRRRMAAQVEEPSKPGSTRNASMARRTTA